MSQLKKSHIVVFSILLLSLLIIGGFLLRSSYRQNFFARADQSCSKDATSYFNSHTEDYGHYGTYTNHFSRKNKRCYIDISQNRTTRGYSVPYGYSQLTETSEYIVDIGENKTIGVLSINKRSFDDSSKNETENHYLVNDSVSTEEQWKSIRAYMNN